MKLKHLKRKFIRDSKDNNPWMLLPMSRRKAKGKAGNSGIVPRNGQISLHNINKDLNKPNWTKYQNT
jgi:hypothetical protein